MLSWLRGTTLFQRIALAFAVVVAVADVVASVAGGVPAIGLFVFALLVCGIAFRKALLWRVRNRLLVTYFPFASFRCISSRCC